MVIAFTMEVHFAEYVTNKGTDEDPKYGELNGTTVTLETGVFKYDFEVKNRIKELAEQYEVDEDSINVQLVQRVSLSDLFIKPIY
jgi:hypothetical protein